MQLFTADWIHHQGTFRREHAVLVDADGRVAAAGPAEAVRAAAGDAEHVPLEGMALSPGAVSAHSHCFQVLLRGHGDHPSSFQDWVRRYLYPLVERIDRDSLEAAALLCFSQMARAGVTSVGEFHYIHNAPGDYTPQSAELARTVIGAARRVGLRITFVRTIYDVQERHGQARFAEPAAEALARIRELHAEFADDPYVSVIPAPHSLHGATEEAIQGAAGLARELDCRWHIHLSEQRNDVGYAERFHGATPLRLLDQWGVLDERATLVHAIWLDEGERALLAERRGGVVSNPLTNMTLGDGIAPLADLIQRGVKVGLGTDLNAHPNVWLELRAAEQLQRVESLRMGRIPSLRDGDPEPGLLFDLATRNPADLLGQAAGALEPGRWADMLALDLEDASLLPASLEGGDALLNAMSSAMVAETAVRHVYVAGRRIVEDREVLGLPARELASRLRAAQG